MGVPETWVDGRFGGTNNSLATRMTDEFIRNSLVPLRNDLKNVFLNIYNTAIGESLNVDCVFPGIQNVDRLFFWYQQGILKRDALIRNICDSEMLDYADFKFEDDDGEKLNETKKQKTGHDSGDSDKHYLIPI